MSNMGKSLRKCVELLSYQQLVIRYISREERTFRKSYRNFSALAEIDKAVAGTKIPRIRSSTWPHAAVTPVVVVRLGAWGVQTVSEPPFCANQEVKAVCNRRQRPSSPLF